MSTIEFNNLVVNASGNLVPYAVKLTKDPDDAQDLIQETLIKALVNRDKFRDGTNIGAWMYTIMKNIFINDYRKKKAKLTILDSTESQYYINQKSLNGHNITEQNLISKDIAKALKRVKPSFRKPFIMHYEGYKYDEISREMGIPVGTVKSRIHWARKVMQEYIERSERVLSHSR